WLHADRNAGFAGSGSGHVREQHLSLANHQCPYQRNAESWTNSSAKQATKKRLLTSPLARAEADRIALEKQPSLI
ncbi:hypothetical protein, partial [Paraburkholderia sp. SIMBA_054]|uniref:hypothetical protein n=1 Tax=Paraburkholderia sp. SIMBA_054 TaxID=3085795 RepID=UPI00397D2CD6